MAPTKPNSSRGRPEGVAVSLISLTLLLTACAEEAPAPAARPPEAGYVVMKSENVPIVIELAGRTTAYETSEVRPQVSGIIKRRLFAEGSVVKAGQVLYEIDPNLYRAAVEQAQANLANAEANAEAARSKADRYKPLAEIEAVSRQDYTDAEAAAKQAAAMVAQNKAALETARINLGYTQVQAPIAGRIGRSLATTGALVTASQADPLTTIQRLDPIFVDIQQSSADLVALRRALATGGVTPASATVRLILEDGSAYPLTGTVEFAEAMVDQSTGTVTLRARFSNPSNLLLPGMYVRASLSQAVAKNAILAPQQGVSRDPRGEATVFVVGAGDKAEQRKVTATRTVGDKWLVTAGLKPGDKVIVEGLDRVRNGQPVTPVPVDLTPDPPQSAGGGAQR